MFYSFKVTLVLLLKNEYIFPNKCYLFNNLLTSFKVIFFQLSSNASKEFKSKFLYKIQICGKIISKEFVN